MFKFKRKKQIPHYGETHPVAVLITGRMKGGSAKRGYGYA
jgi:hypothetical protein